jgi:hypothetical protein
MLTVHRALPAVLLAAVVMIATPACASSYGPYRRTQGPGMGDARAYDIGYREGFEHGRDDGRQGRAFDYSRHGDYRSADGGYRGGNRGQYRQVFRDGFTTGYSDAYRQFGRNRSDRYGRNDRDGSRDPRYGGNRAPGAVRLASPAAEQGFRDGYAQGREDARDGDRNDPRRARRYREGDHDYQGRYGSRDAYKRDYRAAFEQGYDQGYRESRR